MFSGIVEAEAVVKDVKRQGGNVEFELECPFGDELTVDQSVSHNGVCLTVTRVLGQGRYTVTAIDETLRRSNLGDLRPGMGVNVERSMKMDGRLDGHIVQGHVDCTARCVAVDDEDGSRRFRFAYEVPDEMRRKGYVTVEKGSVAVNGVSLTVCDSEEGAFSVAIIPYTLEHTNFSEIVPGTRVNLEFDIIGKYVARMFA